MRTPEQVKWDFVQQWLDKARSDLRVAEILLESDLEHFDNVGFHAQQAAEKFIKALLVRHQIEFPKTHDIEKLRYLADKAHPSISEQLRQADVLTPYGVEYRYPGNFVDLSRTQAKGAYQLATHVQQIVVSHLKSYLGSGRPPDPNTTK